MTTEERMDEYRKLGLNDRQALMSTVSDKCYEEDASLKKRIAELQEWICEQLSSIRDIDAHGEYDYPVPVRGGYVYPDFGFSSHGMGTLRIGETSHTVQGGHTIWTKEFIRGEEELPMPMEYPFAPNPDSPNEFMGLYEMLEKGRPEEDSSKAVQVHRAPDSEPVVKITGEIPETFDPMKDERAPATLYKWQPAYTNTGLSGEKPELEPPSHFFRVSQEQLAQEWEFNRPAHTNTGWPAFRHNIEPIKMNINIRPGVLSPAEYLTEPTDSLLQVRFNHRELLRVSNNGQEVTFADNMTEQDFQNLIVQLFTISAIKDSFVAPKNGPFRVNEEGKISFAKDFTVDEGKQAVLSMLPLLFASKTT